jgi:hypothetical protein
LIAEIDERLQAVNEALAGYDGLISERDRLLRAKAALLGEAASKAVGDGKRISQAEVAEFLSRAPGSKPGEIAAALSAKQPAISSHLYRGKDSIFLSRDARWYVRSSPENSESSPRTERGS